MPTPIQEQRGDDEGGPLKMSSNNSNSLFDRQKALKLSKVDLSRKGSVDEPILEFLKRVNAHPDYVSTSSCSGRTVIYRNDESKKQGCQWILVKHELLTADDDVWSLLNNKGDDEAGVITLKFEPFILHVQCRDLDSAKRLMTLAVDTGFRNSGITIGKPGKIVLAIRSTQGLEVPLTDEDGRLLVDETYVKFVTDQANLKFQINSGRFANFEKRCSTTLWPNPESDEC